MFLGDTTSGYSDREVVFQHISLFLAERIDALRGRFVRLPARRVAVHEHGGLPGLAEAARAVLAAIPGIELVRVDEKPEEAFTCDIASLTRVPLALRQAHEKLIDNAGAEDVEVVLDMYHGCHMLLCQEEGRQPFRVENFISFIAEAMGLERREDAYKRFALLHDADEVVEQALTFIDANSLKLERVRPALPRLFGWPAPGGRV
jgi:heterodisulfide reductase subunit D